MTARVISAWLYLYLCFIFSSINKAYSKRKSDLVFNEKHQFKILQLTDLHYGESNEKDVNSTRLTEFLINVTKPDFVAITGDSVSGYAWDQKNFTWSKQMWQNWTKVFTKTNTKYAYAFGNHDAQADFNREEIYELEVKNPYSYSYRTYDINGLSNFIVPIKSSLKKGAVGGLLWFLDTNMAGCGKMNSSETWGCIEDDQVEWYAKQSSIINKLYGKIDGLAFFHIPIPEYRDVYNWRATYGTRNEGVNCPKVNTKMFAEMLKWQNIKATFAGHDHNNDYGGFYQGIELVYGRKTGYGGYGPDFFQRGARLITITEYLNSEGNVRIEYEHKVIQEDGTVDNQMSWWRGFFNYAKQCEYQ